MDYSIILKCPISEKKLIFVISFEEYFTSGCLFLPLVAVYNYRIMKKPFIF